MYGAKNKLILISDTLSPIPTPLHEPLQPTETGLTAG